MRPPTTLFGLRAVWCASARATETGRFEIGDLTIQVFRWEVRDVTLDSLDLGNNGHVIGYAVQAPDEPYRMLYQHTGSSFYEEEGSPPLTCLQKQLRQGDGIRAPKWHKGDRAWPVAGTSVFEFVGQGYVASEVIYVFRHPSEYRFAIFSDALHRQDADEHYADEERRWRRR